MLLLSPVQTTLITFTSDPSHGHVFFHSCQNWSRVAFRESQSWYPLPTHLPYPWLDSRIRSKAQWGNYVLLLSSIGILDLSTKLRSFESNYYLQCGTVAVEINDGDERQLQQQQQRQCSSIQTHVKNGVGHWTNHKTRRDLGSSKFHEWCGDLYPHTHNYSVAVSFSASTSGGVHG